MDQLIKEYADQQFKVIINGIEYNAIFRKVEGELGFEIATDNTLELEKMWRNIKVKLINGIYENRCITLINSFISKISDSKITLKIDIMIDGFEIGKKIKNKRITKFESSYYGIEEFDLSKIYENDFKEQSVKMKPQSDSFRYNNGTLRFNRLYRMNTDWYIFVLNKIVSFEFKYNNKTDIYTSIKDIWHLRNLFCIFSKKEIEPKEINIYDDKNHKAVVFMNLVREPNYKEKNELLEMEIRSFLIEYKDIKANFESILNNSIICFERIKPVISMYLDSKEKEMPVLNKFLAFTQMIECFSREYDGNNSKLLMLKKEPQKKKKDTELKYRIGSLIGRVNCIYSFRLEKVLKLSEKIAKGRNYYIHHDKSKQGDELKRDELFRYSYFLEDILLANIYLEIGIDKKIIEKVFENPFYYRIKAL